MACFVCKQNGHWARECPSRACDYCGKLGHTSNICVDMKRHKPDVPISETIPASRTRSRKVACMSFQDILFDNHIAAKPNMKENIDLFIKSNFVTRGMVDEYVLANHVFANSIISLGDQGHLAVIGYILSKYCDVTLDTIKNFLRSMICEMDDWDTSSSILHKWNITPVRKNGNIYFRKFVGSIA